MFRVWMNVLFVIGLLAGGLLAGCAAPAGLEAVDATEPVAPVETPAPVTEATPARVTTPEVGETQPATEEAPVSGRRPQQVTEEFYEWYLGYGLDSDGSRTGSPLSDGAYRDRPDLAPEWVAEVDRLPASFADNSGYDPFLCAQNWPPELKAEAVWLSRAAEWASEPAGMPQKAAVLMRFPEYPSYYFTVDLAPEAGEWRIRNVTCNWLPEGVVKAFYTWYLGYAEGASGEMRNPTAEGAYRDSGFLTEEMIRSVDDLVATFKAEDTGGFDPFLLAQDLPQAFETLPGASENTVVVAEQFGAGALRYLVVSLQKQGADWLIDAISALPELEPGVSQAPGRETPSTGLAGWQSFEEAEYGFSLKVPAGWTVNELETGANPLPEDWPVKRTFTLQPADLVVGEETVAPFQVQVLTGDLADFLRVFPAPAKSLGGSLNGYPLTVQWNEPGYVQYVIAHPAQPGLWVIIEDYVGNFPGREAQAQAAAGVLAGALSSFTFTR